jgi:dsDNA-specific endonuclease/ATPase MutS2
MKLFASALTLLVSFLILSCANPLIEENKKLREQIIGVHDEVMPKMGELKALEKKASEQVDSLYAQDSTATAEIESLRALASQLNQAHEDMFVWMRQYSLEEEGKTPEEIKIYLDEQWVKVNQVNKSIQSALQQAEEKLKH